MTPYIELPIQRRNLPRRLPEGDGGNVYAFKRRQTVTIALSDVFPLFDKIHAVVDAHARDNVELDALMLGAVDWLTVREWANSKPYPVDAREDFGTHIFGVKLLCDPRRDTGHPVPIYSTSTAMELYALDRSGAR